MKTERASVLSEIMAVEPGGVVYLSPEDMRVVWESLARSMPIGAVECMDEIKKTGSCSSFIGRRLEIRRQPVDNQ